MFEYLEVGIFQYIFFIFRLKWVTELIVKMFLQPEDEQVYYIFQLDYC